MLRACDLSIFPLYGHKYCLAAHSGALAAERARMAELQTDLQQAELTYAQKPKCAPPAPQSRQAELQPKPQTDPQPPPLKEDKLKVPKNLSDLHGCWQTVKGDQQFYTDDEEDRPVGPKVRQCFCFGGDGHGVLKLLYADGVKCRASLVARIDGSTLQFRHPTVHCPGRGDDYGLVPGFVECENIEGSDGANCLTHNLGRMKVVSTEQYHRVDKDYCQ